MRTKLRQFGLVFMGLFAGILISVQYSAVAQKEATGGLPLHELRAFADAFNAVKQGYVEPVEDGKLINHAISGMLSNLDPHSTYLDADAFKDLQVSTQGEFGGLGIEVGMEEGLIKVIAPIEDTPAWRAGVKAGDFIVKLDDTPVRGMTLNDAVKKMRGKPKTQIKITIARKGETKPLEIIITRDKIKVQSVKSKALEGGYGYLRVTQFQEETAADVVKHMDKLFKNKEGKPEPLKGLVLDLRNDPGGLLHGAVGVAAAFLPTGTLITSTDGRTEDARRKYLATTEHYLHGHREDFLKGLPPEAKTVPMIVLVNGGSASASEIVAGALQDHQRAVVMGTQTFGKGSVQTILPLSQNTAIKLTTARYYTPNGRSIQAKGIEPDITVEETQNGTTRERLREADLDRHLDNGKGTTEKPATKPATPPAKKGSPATEEGDAHKPPIEFASKDDYQLGQAVNLLKALHVTKKR
ncbi:MAG: S41 family peptidase [Rhodocyclaceae bacterium]|nr:S41 family peptidase [Rhodocyclaceae bacterium]